MYTLKKGEVRVNGLVLFIPTREKAISASDAWARRAMTWGPEAPERAYMQRMSVALADLAPTLPRTCISCGLPLDSDHGC